MFSCNMILLLALVQPDGLLTMAGIAAAAGYKLVKWLAAWLAA